MDMAFTREAWLEVIEREIDLLRDSVNRKSSLVAYDDGKVSGIVTGAYFAGAITKDEFNTLRDTITEITMGDLL